MSRRRFNHTMHAHGKCCENFSFHLLQILGDIMAWTVWPRPGMCIVIQHSWHYMLGIAAVFVAELGTFDIIIVRHAESVESIRFLTLMKTISSKYHFELKEENWMATYTWPNSCAMVNAAESPLSWTIAHDDGRHMVPNSANPNVSHFAWFVFRQICSLQWMKWQNISEFVFDVRPKCQEIVTLLKEELYHDEIDYVAQTYRIWIAFVKRIHLNKRNKHILTKAVSVHYYYLQFQMHCLQSANGIRFDLVCRFKCHTSFNKPNSVTKFQTDAHTNRFKRNRFLVSFNVMQVKEDRHYCITSEVCFVLLMRRF